MFSPLANRVQSLILATFDISEVEAKNQAEGLTALAEGWGDTSRVGQLDWPYIIRKKLDGQFSWQSETERQRFTAEQKDKIDAYEKYILVSKSKSPRVS